MYLYTNPSVVGMKHNKRGQSNYISHIAELYHRFATSYTSVLGGATYHYIKKIKSRQPLCIKKFNYFVLSMKVLLDNKYMYMYIHFGTRWQKPLPARIYF